jgi:NAD(P)-dependent dehydrogenase (short-subunit alcohol dehydrogenase family)
MPLEALHANNVAVITGGASGIGLAAAIRFAKAGMKVCIADVGAERLKEAEPNCRRRRAIRQK